MLKEASQLPIVRTFIAIRQTLGSMHKCGVIECLNKSIILFLYHHKFERHRRKNALVYSLREIRGSVVGVNKRGPYATIH